MSERREVELLSALFAKSQFSLSILIRVYSQF